MPKMRWKDLPPALREHLFERLRERKISAEDLYELKLWRESEPEASTRLSSRGDRRRTRPFLSVFVSRPSECPHAP
jgi:hypothetical protein